MSISAACRWCARRRRQAPTKASPRAAFRSSIPAARCAHACAEIRQIFLAAAAERLGVEAGVLADRGRHDFRSRQCQDQLLGAGRRRLARPRCDAGRQAESRSRSARSPANPRNASTFPTRFSRVGASSMTPRCPACCMAACCGRRYARAKLARSEGRRGARRSRLCRGRARRQLSPAWSARPRLAPRPRSPRCARARPGPKARRCRTKTISPRFLKAQPVESTVIDTRTAASPQAEGAHAASGNIPVPISRMPRSRRPARWRNGPAAIACMSGPTARASISCATISRWC